MVNCTKCEISHKRKHVIKTEGVSKPSVLFIGNSPSYTDDKYNGMYMNTAGKAFEEILNTVGLLKYSAVTYAVKCYTGSRQPNDIEIHNCLPYLIKDLMRPSIKVIVLLGSTAIKSYYGNPRMSVTKNLGKARVINNRIVLSTYSPNYVLVPGGKDRLLVFVEHMLLVKKILKQWLKV